jgi:hypothetical protein
LVLFVGQVGQDVPVGAATMQVAIYWLLALGCTGFLVTFLRVGNELVEVDWHIVYELDLTEVLRPERDRRLDHVLARGLGPDRSADFWPAGAWRIFLRIGLTFWLVSAIATGLLVSGYPVLSFPQRGMLLLILMIPAVQCTAAAIIGPGLTRMLELREAAREARRRLCEQQNTPGLRPSATALRPLDDLQDAVTIDLRAIRGVCRRDRPAWLHVVEEDATAGSGGPGGAEPMKNRRRNSVFAPRDRSAPDNLAP